MNRLIYHLSTTSMSYLLVPAMATLQRKCACGNHTTSGECAECAREKNGLQRKLYIGAISDPLEHEANRVADQVMSRPALLSLGRTPPKIQRFTNTASEHEGEVPESVSRALSSSGRLLDLAVRQEMEPRFGHDFSRVRVHQGSSAEKSARDVNARAYTVGNHIVFGAGEYAPASAAGQHLIAHELTHVVQQGTASRTILQRTLAGCQALLSNPSVVSLVSGSVVHRIIGGHFQGSVQDAITVAIPGGSAAPQRSEAICGAETPVVAPQLVGGMSGAGIPDLARRTASGVLQVAEIKPAAIACLIDGEEQLLRYIDQGNSRDAAQSTWRASLGVSVVSPMLESAYNPPNLQVSLPGIANANLRTAWCSPGLLAYTVDISGQPILVPVPRSVRNESRDRLRRESEGRVPAVAIAAGATAIAAVAGRALWRHFWRVVVQRFAIRGAIALALSAADGPLPFGELASLGMALFTIAEIISAWDDIWREADRVAGKEA